MVDLILYSLQKQFNTSVQLYTDQILSTNLTTGVIRKNVIINSIKKAIILPITLARQFMFELTHREFGISDLTQRVLLIRKRDLPTTFTINLEAYFIINGETLYIEKVENLLEGKGYAFILKGNK